MPEEVARESRALSDGRDDADVREAPSLLDGMRYLYRRRFDLAVRFVVFVGLGIVVFAVWYATAPSRVQGSIALRFRGIEKHEYPSGSRFTVEDFRSPAVLSGALNDAGIPQYDLKQLIAGTLVTPIIPGDVQARWRKQERDGARRDEFFPNEFVIGLHAKELSAAQHIRLFDAIVKNYQSRVKYEQQTARRYVASGLDGISYETLAGSYDFWDIPSLFEKVYRSLDWELRGLLVETLQYPDSKYQLAFRNVARELSNWHSIRLGTLEAMTYQGRLVKNKDLMLNRVRYRLDNVDIEIKQKNHEVTEGLRLLAQLDRPSNMIASQANTDKSLPVIDVGIIERLLKTDYVGPLVAKLSKLQSDAQELEAERARLQIQLAALPKAANSDFRELPPAHREVVERLSTELHAIMQKYTRFLDEYLTASVTSLVAVKQSPIVIRDVYSPALALIAIVAFSFFLAIVLMSLEHLFRRMKEYGGAAR